MLSQTTTWDSKINLTAVTGNLRLTVAPRYAARYLNQDSRVAEDHDDQRQEEEAHEGEHVVEGLLPVLDKTPMGGALGEVLGDCDGYVVKYKHLHDKRRRVLLSKTSKIQREWTRTKQVLKKIL